MKFSTFLSAAALLLGLSMNAAAQTVTITAPWSGGSVNILPPQINIGGNVLSSGGTIYARIRLYAGAESFGARSAGLLTYDPGPAQTFEASRSAQSGSSGQWTYVGSQTGVIFDNVVATSNVPSVQITNPVDVFSSVTATAQSSCSGLVTQNSVVSHQNGGNTFSTGGQTSQVLNMCCSQFYSMYTATNAVILMRGYAPGAFAFIRLGAPCDVQAILSQGPGC